MKNETKKCTIIAAGLLTAFVLWTIAVCCIDVRAVGALSSSVGFAGVNLYFHELTGVHMALYYITDWLSLVPFCFILAFAALGLVQLIRRKNIRQVDHNLLVLGGFYIVVMAVYIFFELVIINYRPILINGILETSYPSSTTVLVMCVMPTAALQLYNHINNRTLRVCVIFSLTAFTVFMVVARLISGVHWLSDIVGGALLSAGLVNLYHALTHHGAT